MKAGLVLTALLLAVIPAQAQARCAPISSLPLRQQDGKLLVEVEVNNRPATFLLDTGGVTSVIATRLAARLNLPTRVNHAKVDVRDAGGARAERYVTIRNVTLGERRIRPRNYIVAELRQGVDGLLAPDLLRDLDLDLDFAGQRLDLYAAGACAGRPPGSGTFSSAAMLDGGWARRIQVETMLDGRPFRATVDTGARQSYVAASAAEAAFGISPARAPGAARGIFGGEVAVTPHDFTTLQLGEMVWENPRLHLASPEDGFDGAPLLLGLQQLQGLRLFVAYSERKLYISRTPQS
jgi:predicted aspartyl protease